MSSTVSVPQEANAGSAARARSKSKDMLGRGSAMAREVGQASTSGDLPKLRDEGPRPTLQRQPTPAVRTGLTFEPGLDEVKATKSSPATSQDVAPTRGFGAALDVWEKEVRKSFASASTGDLPTIAERRAASGKVKNSVRFQCDTAKNVAGSRTCPELINMQSEIDEEDTMSEVSEASELSEMDSNDCNTTLSHAETDAPIEKEAPLPTLRKTKAGLPCSRTE